MSNAAVQDRARPSPFHLPLWQHHLEELGFLFGQWRAALFDPEHTLDSVGELEERIRAHLDGVRAPGDAALPMLVEALQGDDADVVFAAAYALCTWPAGKGVDPVLEAFESAEDDRLTALGLALSYGQPAGGAAGPLRSHLGGEPVERAMAAAEVLAFHGALELSGAQLRFFLEHEDAGVRARAWKLAGLMSAAVPPTVYAGALRDDEAAVTHAALEAGAWCGEQGTLHALRRVAGDQPSPDQLPQLHLFAVLARPDDLTLVRRLVGLDALGPDRFRLAGAAGDPGLVEMILERLEDPDPVTAAAAASAFTRLTGVEIESEEAVPVPPADGTEPDEFEAEFQDEVVLPDAARARQAWDELRPRLSSARRLCRGYDTAQPLPAEALEALDMQSRGELFLRSRFHGLWAGTRLALERFPQRSGG
jgi:uncharacterized protein (TIGR02270 family)